MMFVSVKYKVAEHQYGEKSYTYQTELPLKLGDKVVANTPKNPMQEALVVGVNMPEPPFKCKAITEYVPEVSADA